MGSAFFAGLTAILGKLGVSRLNSNLGGALIVAGALVIATG